MLRASADHFLTDLQVREEHRAWLEEGKGSRDVVIVAHGHFNRVFISRWINFPLALGKPIRLGCVARYRTHCLLGPGRHSLQRRAIWREFTRSPTFVTRADDLYHIADCHTVL